MSRLSSIILIFAGFAGVAVADPPVEVRPPRTDSYGDPLPKGAIARLGTIRWKGSEQMRTIAFSPDGKRVAATCTKGLLRIWDSASGLPLREYSLPFAYQVFQMVFAADQNSILCANGPCVHALNLETGKSDLVSHPFPLKNSDKNSIISQSGKWVLSHNYEGRRHQLGLHELGKSDPPRDLGSVYLLDPAPNQDLRSQTALSSNGRWAALAAVESDDTGRVFLFDTVAGRTWTSPSLENAGSFRLTFCPDDDSLVVGINSQLFRWKIEAAKSPETSLHVRLGCQYGRAETFNGDRNHFCFTANGKHLLVSSNDDGIVRLFDTRSGELRRSFYPSSHKLISCLAASTDGSLLAMAFEYDDCVCLFEIATGRELFPHRGHRGPVTDLAFLPSGNGLASYCATDGSIRTWALTPKRVPISISAKKSIVEDRMLSREFARIQSQIGSHNVVFADEGRLLFSVNNGNIWVMETDKRPPRCNFIHSNNVAWRSMAVSPDGSTLALALAESGLQLIDTRSGKPCPNQPNLKEVVTGMFFSPDGKTVGAIANDGFHVFDVKTGRNRKPVIAANEGMASRFFASYVEIDRTVQIWDRSTGRLVRQIDQIEQIFVLAPDGRYLASFQSFNFAVHEVATGQIVLQGTNGNERVTSLRYSPDGNLLAVGYGNGTILLWDLRTPLKKIAQPLQSATLWNDLADDSAEKAYAAIGALSSSPKEALTLLKEKLKPAEPIGPQVVAQLLADLNHSRYAVREKATRQLEKLIHQLSAELEKAFDRSEPEVQWRIERVLKAAQQPLAGGDGLRSIRCVEILERIGSVEARELLDKLARGAGLLAREARDSLERLRGR